MSLKRHSPSLSGKRNHCTPWFQTGVCITHNMTPSTTGRQRCSHFPPAKPPCTRGPPSFSTSHYSDGKRLSQCSPQSLCFTAACTAGEGASKGAARLSTASSRFCLWLLVIINHHHVATVVAPSATPTHGAVRLLYHTCKSYKMPKQLTRLTLAPNTSQQ